MERGNKDEKEEERGKQTGIFKGPVKKENFLVMLLIGILLLVITWPTEKSSNEKESQSKLSDMSYDILDTTTEVKVYKEEWQEYLSIMEATLEEVLSVMEGAGKVKVMITLKDSGEKLVEKDVITQIKGDTAVDGSGSQNISDRYEEEQSVFASSEEGEEFPYVRKVISPQVEGVVVCAQGGDNLQVKKNITEAIQALFGIDAHKIKVIKMSSKS